MKVYLVQHASALAKDEDPDRPLSAEGRTDAQCLAEFAAGAGVRPGLVLHSGKKRAEQTAGILAAAVGAEEQVRQFAGLKPKDPVTPIADTLAEEPGDILVVGHLPFMAKLASLLATGDAERLQVAFSPGSMVCLERGDQGNWSLAWMIRPELLQGIAR